MSNVMVELLNVLLFVLFRCRLWFSSSCESEAAKFRACESGGRDCSESLPKMTLRRTLPNGIAHTPASDDSRPVKRVKTYEADPPISQAEDYSTLVRRHPLGVKPSGNALTSTVNLKSRCGRFAQLPDELINSFLETLQVPHLLRLGSTCKALHAFTRSEELWRTLFIE